MISPMIQSRPYANFQYNNSKRTRRRICGKREAIYSLILLLFLCLIFNWLLSSSPAMSQQRALCMIPGPIEFHEDVLTAMGTGATSHVDPKFLQTFGQSLQMLRTVFQCALLFQLLRNFLSPFYAHCGAHVRVQTGQPFILSGSGTLGWDAVLVNLLNQQTDRLLIVNTGYFGDRMGDCADSYKIQNEHVRPSKLGAVPSLKDIETALLKTKYKMIHLTHVDTSTGVLVNVKSIATLVKQVSPDTLVVVDGVCSIGGEELLMDEWGVDAAITASQKALGTPSGLLVMMFGPRAIKIVEERTEPVPNYYVNLKNWLPIMRAYEANKPSYFATPAVNLIQALHVSLKQITAQPMSKRFQAHVQAGEKVQKTLKQWGLQLVPTDPQHTAHTLTAVFYPDSVAPTDLLPKIVKRGVMVAGGLHPEMATKYFRIGHMGLSAVDTQRGHIDLVLDAVKEALIECGYQVE